MTTDLEIVIESLLRRLPQLDRGKVTEVVVSMTGQPVEFAIAELCAWVHEELNATRQA
jgi:hypothetical protein